MEKINYQKIYETNQDEWKALTREPQKYEALLAGHYSDSNHFVYELLQNAEDARASKVVFEYYEDKLVFYHNGKPFDENDVKGVSSMLMGTKDKNDASTIGRFGMGFKSVFKYTYQPEIYSDDEAFKIENYLLPVEINGSWNYNTVKCQLCYENGSGGKFYPFMKEEHLTKFVIPFAKISKTGDIVPVSGKEVLAKLEGLTGEILLFLSNIKSLYWVDKTSNKYAKIDLSEADNDSNLVTCRIMGSTHGSKEEITRYLRYKKIFDHEEMANAEVSVAYKVNSRANNINEMEDTDIFVYFPTRDKTNLPFLIHGSFETAVSREKLMTPSAFNQDLFDELGYLIADTLDDLKNRKMITQVFIRRVLLAAFEDEEENDTIPGLKEKVTAKFISGSYLPNREGSYEEVKNLYVPVPFGIAEISTYRWLIGLSTNGPRFVAFNNERETNFTEYFNWLINDLDVKTYTLDKWANALCTMEEQTIKEDEIEQLHSFYDFLSNNRESVYETSISYTRSGPYERMIKNVIGEAWKKLRRAPIILNEEGRLVAAYKNEKPNIYLGASSKYKSIVSSAIVDSKVAREFSRLLDDGFEIPEFDNFQYIKEKIIAKYVEDSDFFDGDNNWSDSSQKCKEYIADIQQLFTYIDETHDVEGIRELLSKAYLIKIKKDDGSILWGTPSQVYVPKSEEGIDLNVYFAPIPYSVEYYMDEDLEEDEEPYEEYTYEEVSVEPIDSDFYERNNISIVKLQQFGLITTAIDQGTRRADGVGDGHWIAMDSFCPQISFDYFDENKVYISYHPDEELAKNKSAEMLKLLLFCKDKLSGKVRYRKNNPYMKEQKAYFLTSYDYKYESYKWLYKKDGTLVSPLEVSKYDLDESVYGYPISDKEAYRVLGFKETEEDNKLDTFELVGALDKKSKKILLKQLAREFGMEVTEVESSYENEKPTEDEVFDPNAWISKEFPVSKIFNKDSLVQHVQEQFFCADVVKYKPLLRTIRISKSSKTVRAYALGMYTNESNVHICQMCKEPAAYTEVTEIANYGIELPQLNLCLCKNCAAKYKSFRDAKKDDFKKQMRQAIKMIEIEDCNGEIEIGLNSDCSVYFTQTHMAELQTIFSLIDEYGLPSEDIDADFTDADNPEINRGPLDHISRNPVEKTQIVSADDDYKMTFTDKGARIRHRSFGEGTVKDYFAGKVRILFDDGKIKDLDLKTCQRAGLITLI